MSSRIFAAGGNPLKGYMRQVANGGESDSGHRLTLIIYVDPAKNPSCREKVLMVDGGYPGFFSVLVDLDEGRIADVYWSAM